jgi:hypothetical protein
MTIPPTFVVCSPHGHDALGNALSHQLLHNGRLARNSLVNCVHGVGAHFHAICRTEERNVRTPQMRRQRSDGRPSRAASKGLGVSTAEGTKWDMVGPRSPLPQRAGQRA